MKRLRAALSGRYTSALTGRHVRRSSTTRGPKTTVREHVAASRASRELARRERAKMRQIEF